MPIKSTHIEAENSELIMRNTAGDIVIIPAKYRTEVQDMVKEQCWDCIDHLVDTLPVMEDYAEDGTVITDEWPPKANSPYWQPPVSPPRVPSPQAINEEPPAEKKTYAQMQFKNSVEKQRYWDQLPAKYGSGVEGRQNYMDLWNKNIPKKAIGDRYPNIADTSQKLPASLKQLQDQYLEVNNKFNELNAKFWTVPKEERQALDRELTDLATQRDSIQQQWATTEENKIIEDAPKKTWNELITSNSSIEDPLLLYVSLMDEGGDQMAVRPYYEKQANGFAYFGLDTFGQRVDEFIKKGYVDPSIKDHMQIKTLYNELGDQVETADFDDMKYVISAKNAFIKQGQSVVDNKAKELGVELSKQARDYFTIMSYNRGETGVREVMDYYNDQGWLKDETFLKDEKLPLENPQKHINALRRIQTMNMMENEGFDVINSSE